MNIQNITEMNASDLDAILAEEILSQNTAIVIADDPALDAEIAEILAQDAEDVPVADIAQATAQANGADEALALAAAEAPVEEETPAPAVADTKTFLEQRDAVTMEQVAEMQKNLQAAFADRAAYERASNPNNDNIQKTLTKVQKGHLAHGISQGFVAAGVDPNYLNKSEVTGKRRNVYALEKLQDLIYGAATGKMKNAINIAILTSMVKLEQQKIDFTGAIAKACASDKVAVEVNIGVYLRRHTVAEGTASTQSSSTMTALEDLNAVVNHGTRQHPRWTFSDTALAQRLKEVVKTAHMPVTV